jgi:hypothetical protein
VIVKNFAAPISVASDRIGSAMMGFGGALSEVICPTRR